MGFTDVARRFAKIGTGITAGAHGQQQLERQELNQALTTALSLGQQGIKVGDVPGLEEGLFTPSGFRAREKFDTIGGSDVFTKGYEDKLKLQQQSIKAKNALAQATLQLRGQAITDRRAADQARWGFLGDKDVDVVKGQIEDVLTQTDMFSAAGADWYTPGGAALADRIGDEDARAAFSEIGSLIFQDVQDQLAAGTIQRNQIGGYVNRRVRQLANSGVRYQPGGGFGTVGTESQYTGLVDSAGNPWSKKPSGAGATDAASKYNTMIGDRVSAMRSDGIDLSMYRGGAEVPPNVRSRLMQEARRIAKPFRGTVSVQKIYNDLLSGG